MNIHLKIELMRDALKELKCTRDRLKNKAGYEKKIEAYDHAIGLLDDILITEKTPKNTTDRAKAAILEAKNADVFNMPISEQASFLKLLVKRYEIKGLYVSGADTITGFTERLEITL